MKENVTRGEYIKLIRRRKKMALVDVAAFTGVSIATLSRIEQDRPALFDNVCAVARVLEIPLSVLANFYGRIDHE